MPGTVEDGWQTTESPSPRQINREEDTFGSATGPGKTRRATFGSVSPIPIKWERDTYGSPTPACPPSPTYCPASPTDFPPSPTHLLPSPPTSSDDEWDSDDDDDDDDEKLRGLLAAEALHSLGVDGWGVDGWGGVGVEPYSQSSRGVAEDVAWAVEAMRWTEADHDGAYEEVVQLTSDDDGSHGERRDTLY